jgi:WXG100 family type VII secretion target
MAAPQVRSDRDQLKQIQGMFSQEAERVNSFWRDLVSKDETLRGGDWIGEGASQFYNEMNGQVYPHLKKLHDALDEAAKTVGQISQLMQEVEENTSKQFTWRLG